jgi:hypothetical protein
MSMSDRKILLILLFTAVIVSNVLFLPVPEAVGITELAYDDGVDESYDCPEQNQWRAVKFVLSDFGISGSWRLLTARVYRSGREGGNGQLELHILNSAGTGDLSGTSPIIFTTIGSGWNDIDLSANNIVVSGDFWIAYRWVNPGANPCIAIDQSAASGRSYDGSPGSWTPYTYDYMIRAVVDLAAAPVGGISSPVNKIEILTPYIALAGLVAAVSTVYIISRRKS